MKAAYDKGNYVALKQLADQKPKDPEVCFYLGIMAENGLEQEIDLASAAKYYQSAWKESQHLKSGIALARIYQKQHQDTKAKRIYEEIIGHSHVVEATPIHNTFVPKAVSVIAVEAKPVEPIDEVSIQYAQYRLARMAAKELLASSNIQKEQAQAAIEEYNKCLGMFAEGSLLHDKILYHRNLLELRLLEDRRARLDKALEKTHKKRIREAQDEGLLTNNAAASAQEEQAQAKLNEAAYKKSNSELEALENKFEALGKKYAPAAAELHNIKARKYLKEQQYSEAIAETERALKADPKNVRAILIAADTKKSQNDLNESLNLARKARVLDPSNKKLFHELQDELVKAISSKISSKLKDNKVDSYFSYFNQWLNTQEQASEEQARKNYEEVIKQALYKSEYIQNYATFENIDKIVSKLNAELLKNTDTPENVIDVIARWSNEQIRFQTHDLSKEEKDCLDNRKLLRAKLVTKLEEFYVCAAAITDHQRIAIKIEDGVISGVAKAAQFGAVFAAAISQNAKLSGGLAAFGIAAQYTEECRKQDIKSAAEEFCKMGRPDGRATGYDRKVYENLADTIVERYGMQIDNIINSDKDIEALAEVAIEKMLSHITSITVADTLYKRIPSIDKFTDWIKSWGGLHAQKDLKYEEKLLRGLVEGQCHDEKNVPISTRKERGGDWYAKDILECPAATANGKDFYLRKGSQSKTDINKYGAIYLNSIADDKEYEKIKAVSDHNRELITKELSMHLNLINNPSWMSKEQREEHKREQKLKTKEELTAEKNAADEQKWTGIAQSIAGIFTIGAAKILGAAFFVGIATSGIVLPLAITTGCVGIAALFSGISNYSQAKEKFTNIDKDLTKQEKSNEIAVPELDIAKQKAAQRIKAFNEIKSHDIYSVQDNKKQQSNAKSLWVQAFPQVRATGPKLLQVTKEAQRRLTQEKVNTRPII